MRLFLAIYPSKEVRDTLRDSIRLFAKQKRQLKFIPLDQLHTTLRFIGPDVSQRGAMELADLLKERTPSGPLTLKLGSLQLGFKHQSFPKHLLTKIEDSQDLRDLGADMKDIVAGYGSREMIRWKERYDDSFHITLARLKKTETKSTARTLRNYTSKQILTGPKEFTVSSYFLVESRVDKGAVHYTKLQEFKI